MGDSNDDKHKARHKSETAEFGQVRTEEDLDDRVLDSANPEAKADERRALANPDGSGYFERKANNLGGALNLEQDFDPTRGQDLRDHAKGVNAVDIDAYEQAYNMYSVPYGMTMKALGRTKDLSTAGAPLTPTEFKKKQPKLAARFAGLTNGREAGSGVASFDNWSHVQKEMGTNVGVTNSAQLRLQAAVAGFKEAHAMIEQRKLAARKAADTTELAEINETAETLARIVDVSVAAVATAAEVESALSESSSLDEGSEGVGDISKVQQSNNPDYVNGTGPDPTGAHLSVPKTATQKAGDAAGDAAKVGAEGNAIAQKVGKALHDGTAGKLKLSLHDIFIVADGDAAKFNRLTQDIKRIDELSGKWANDQFRNAVTKARLELDSAVMEVHARQMGNRGDSVDARRMANDFATAIGGGTEGQLAMYSAEAYQELAAHGDNAQDIRKRLVDEPWKLVFHWMNNYPAAIGGTLAGRDAKALANNLQEVREQRESLDDSLPEWKERAAEWSAFFSRPLA